MWLWGVFSSFLECWIVNTNWPINSPRRDVWNELIVCDVPTKNEFKKQKKMFDVAQEVTIDIGKVKI